MSQDREGTTIGGRSPTSPPAPMDDQDLLAEILLRLPPHPSSLPRASAVCKRWLRLLADPNFLRRFRAHHHGKPPLLGIFRSTAARPSVFAPALDPPDRIPAARFSLRTEDGEEHQILGCRHGLVLLIRWRSRLQMLVRDPVARLHRRVAVPPDFHFGNNRFVIDGALSCAAARDQGHVHGSCHSSPFKIALVAADAGLTQLFARVYSSQTATWGNTISLAAQAGQLDANTLLCFRQGILVGKSFYWTLSLSDGQILELDLDRESLALIELPPYVGAHKGRFSIVPMDDGGVGVVVVSRFRAQLWKRMADCSAWVPEVTIELGKLLPLKPGPAPILGGFDEDNNEIVLQTASGLFRVHLQSMRFHKLSGTTYEEINFHPFTSFYAAGVGIADQQDGAEV